MGTKLLAPAPILLHNGDRMDRETFHALYEQTPPGFRAELIQGVVYVASPTKFRHSRPHTWLAVWLGNYATVTPGTDPLVEATHLLDDGNEPEPDAVLRLTEEYGGQSRETADDYITGPPELVVEVAHTSAAIDLHDKRAAYEEVGVREYLVVVVKAKQVVWYARGRGGFVELRPGSDGVFRSRVFPGLWLDPTALFPLDRRRLMDTLRTGLASPEHAAFVAKLAARAAKRKPKPKPGGSA
ncbi:MAG: Uma2 family endonuclease [Fimbriiglobus sp.]